MLSRRRADPSSPTRTNDRRHCDRARTSAKSSMPGKAGMGALGLSVFCGSCRSFSLLRFVPRPPALVPTAPSSLNIGRECGAMIVACAAPPEPKSSIARAFGAFVIAMVTPLTADSGEYNTWIDPSAEPVRICGRGRESQRRLLCRCMLTATDLIDFRMPQDADDRKRRYGYAPKPG